MKLLLKHWAKTIKLRPLQPVIITAILLFSIVSIVMSMTIHSLLLQESQILQDEGYGNADISISLNGTCKSRFMFESDVNDLFEGRAKVAGTYELPLSYGENKQTVFGVAVDLYKIENIFSFEFLQYGKISTSTVESSVFISNDFADKNGIALGDKVSFSMFGEDKSYTVVGIAKHRFLASYDVMVDIGGVVRVLGKDSTLIANLGEKFKPSSTIFIDVPDGDSIYEYISILKENDDFSDKTISNVSNIIAEKMNTQTLEIPIVVVAILMAILSAIMVFSSLFVISSERTEENYILSVAGARPSLLDFMQHLEIFIYWGISTILSVIIIKPITNLLINYLDFEYATSTIFVDKLIIGIVAILLVSMISVSIFVASRKMKNKPKVEKKINTSLALILLALLVLVFILQIIAPVKIKFVLYVPVLILVAFVIMVGMPIILKRLLKKIDTKQDAIFEKKLTLKHRSIRYAIKNVFRVKAIHNTSRLVALMVGIVLTFSVVLISARGNVYMLNHIFDSDYAVINATERCKEKIDDCESVKSSYSVYMDNSTHNETIFTYVFASDNLNVFSDDMELTFLPKGDGAIISTGQSKLLNLKIGDKFYLKVAESNLELTVVDIVKSGIATVVFDAEHFGIPYNMIMVDGKDEVSRDELISELSNKTSSELAVISSLDQLIEEKIKPVYIYIDAANLLILITIIYVCIGLCNNLYDSYRSRKGEMELYYLAGMSKKEIKLMKISEISITFLIGIIIGVLSAILLIYSTQIGMYTFGYETLISAFKVI